MRQIVSLIKDNQVHYALVDDDSGELIPFADILLPNPDGFGLHDAAVLGTNLISTLGLNGKRSNAKVAAPAEPEALPPAPKAKATPKARRGGGVKGSNASGKGGAERFISLDDVMTVVNQHPEGVTTRQIAEQIYHQDGGTGEMPYWYMNSVGNRQTIAEQKLKDKGTPLPFRIEYRAKLGKNGLPTQLSEKILLPLSAHAEAVSRHETGVSSDA